MHLLWNVFVVPIFACICFLSIIIAPPGLNRFFTLTPTKITLISITFNSLVAFQQCSSKKTGEFSAQASILFTFSGVEEKRCIEKNVVRSRGTKFMPRSTPVRTAHFVTGTDRGFKPRFFRSEEAR